MRTDLWLTRYPVLRRAAPALIIALLTLWRGVVAIITPVLQDEAYYYDWSGTLGWGYFDHPPAVAVLGLGSLFLPGNTFVARLGTVIVGTLTLMAVWKFYRACGLRGPLLSLALLLIGASLPGLVAGVITTPDTVLALFWVLALHEGLAALNGRRERWLTAGLATGLGLLGKYTMLVIGPVFLFAILAADRRVLLTRWPYLGALVALLIFTPHVVWNAVHDWVTFRFQFGHGFATDTGRLTLAAHELLGVAAPEAGEHAGTAAPPIITRAARLLGFLAMQLALWGMPVLVILFALARNPAARHHLCGLRPQLSYPAAVLLFAGAAVPLIVFGIVATGSDVEANWAAVYTVAAAPLLAAAGRPVARWLALGAATNILLITLYATHAATAGLPLPETADRILRESHGYRELTTHVRHYREPLFAHRYQVAAMLNFYDAGSPVAQWPGLSRPSEYSLAKIVPVPKREKLAQSGFTLVVRGYGLPAIPGFQYSDVLTLYDCRGEPLTTFAGIGWPEDAHCEDHLLHTWRILRYEPHDPS